MTGGLAFMPEPESHYRARRAWGLVDRAADRFRRRHAADPESRLTRQAWMTLRHLHLIYYLGIAQERRS